MKDDPEVVNRDPMDPSPFTFVRQYRGRMFGYTELTAREYKKIRERSTEKRLLPDPDTGIEREIESYNRETEEMLLRAKCVKELDPTTRAALDEPTDYDVMPLRVYSAINRDIGILLYDPEENQLAAEQAKQAKDNPEATSGNGR